MTKTLSNQTVEWNKIPWRKLERNVFKLQKRIYRASSRGDVRAVRRLQKTLMRSWSAKCLAVRRVTQDNQGKKTAGVDGIKSLTPVQRLELVQNLKLSRKAKPTRRVWIPKPGTEEKRPLGIPTITDRARQALVKQALEPEWEALFEPNSYGIIRYADDFVVLHENLAVVQSCQQIIAEWLKDMGLELKPSKTHISHTLNQYEGNVGFDFLGFNVRQYQVAEEYSARDTKGRILGFKTLIKPSKEAIKRHVEKIGKIIDAHKSKPQIKLIGELNPIIKGWANYYSTSVSKETFSRIDHIVYQQLLAWAKRSHRGTPVKEIVNKCWQTIENDRWVFATKEGKETTARLLKHVKTPIIRHEKVKGEASPYDGNLVYWSTRRRKHPECPQRIAELLWEQKGKCTWCKLHFREDDLLEIDHSLPISQGGEDVKANRQLLHRHCHDEKTALDIIKFQKQLANEELTKELDDNPW